MTNVKSGKVSCPSETSENVFSSLPAFLEVTRRNKSSKNNSDKASFPFQPCLHDLENSSAKKLLSRTKMLKFCTRRLCAADCHFCEPNLLLWGGPGSGGD